MIRDPVRSSCVLAMCVIACAPAVTDEPIQPERWDRELQLTELPDLNPDPRIVEIDLLARTATLTLGPMHTGRGLWTYAGQLPGPLIRARAGDRLIVHFTNALPRATTIHWHGVRLPANMDGVPGHSQREVEPGATFDYDFVVPDAGLYWYHPHVSSAAGVGFGLYGALLVEDPEEEELDADEVVLVLSDLALREDGTLYPPDVAGDLATLFGREGNVVLVNGKVRPTLRARVGRRQRWRIVNSAKSRYFQLELPGHRFMTIGADGGRISAPIEEGRLLIIPGERADVLITPQGTPGDTLQLRWIPFDRGYGTAEFRDPETIMYVALDERPAVARAPLQLRSPEIAGLDPAVAKPIELRLEQIEDGSDQLILGINGQPSWEAPPIPAHLGDTHRFTITNDMDWSHPFHLHGFFFQVIGESPPIWRDTIDVPYKSRTEVLVRYDDRPGMWMFHCHILDHADAGMMGMIELGSH